MYLRQICVLCCVALLAAIPPADKAQPTQDPAAAGDRQRGPDSSPLEQAVAAIWKDAGVAADPQHEQLLGGHSLPHLRSTPHDLRKLQTDWPGDKFLTTSPIFYLFCHHGQLDFRWHAKITSAMDEDEAGTQLATMLEPLGYQRLSTQEEIASIAKSVSLSLAPRTIVYARKSGDTELAIFLEVQHQIGSPKYRTGTEITLVARRPYQGPQPTLDETLAVLPAWARVKYLHESFYASLGKEPITALFAGMGLAVHFEKPITDQLIKVLESGGFELEARPANDLPDGSVQRTWYRYTDITYAHIITPKDGKSVRFSCQAPQHQGEPITKKPPRLHPVLALRDAERPVLEFEQLPFADDELKRLTRLFQDLAEQTAGKDWLVQHYKDVRHSASPHYVASWRMSEVKGSGYLTNDRRYRGLSIGVEGRAVDGADQLEIVEHERRLGFARWLGGHGQLHGSPRPGSCLADRRHRSGKPGTSARWTLFLR